MRMVCDLSTWVINLQIFHWRRPIAKDSYARKDVQVCCVCRLTHAWCTYFSSESGGQADPNTISIWWLISEASFAAAASFSRDLMVGLWSWCRFASSHLTTWRSAGMLLITQPGILDHSFVSTGEYSKAWKAPLYVLPIPSFLPTSM